MNNEKNIENYERTELIVTEFIIEDVLLDSTPAPRQSIYEPPVL